MAIQDREKLHHELFKAHKMLTGGADALHTVIVDLARDCRYPEDQAKFGSIAQALAEARKRADEAWQLAADARTNLLGLTGCDGNCSP